MNYPIDVSDEGNVYPKRNDFLDLGGPIMGTKSTVLPSTLTG